jgi:tetratricopeptide (TPR) repeat protein
VSEAAPKRRRIRLPNPPRAIRIHPLFWPLALFELTIAWLATRRWLVLLACFPVLFAAGSLVWAAVHGHQITERDQTRHYLTLADNAEQQGDKDMLEICYRKISNMPLEASLKYHVASFLISRKRLDQARVLMHELAPANKRGYPLAHKWVALDMLQVLAEPTTEAILPLDIFFHAKIAADELPQDQDAVGLYGLLLVRAGRLEEALDYFSKVAEIQPALYLSVAELQSRLGKDDQAKLSRVRAKDHFRWQLTDNPKNVNARINLVRAMLPDGEIKEAVASLREGLVLKDDRLLRIALADCSVWKFDSLSVEDREGIIGLNLLNYAITNAPAHGPTLERIALVAASTTNKDWEQMRERLHQCLAEGNAPATCHLFLANGYFQQKEYDKARTHLELAHRLDSRMVLVLNNLAWLMAFVEPINLTRAEELIDQAVRLASTNNVASLEVRETRGQIKLKLKKYTEAISDLEFVLSSYNNRKKIRIALAEAYEAHGDSELAAKYRN